MERPLFPAAARPPRRNQVTTDPAAAFAHFRAEAERVPVTGLPVFNGRPAIVLVNVQHALAALEPGVELVAQRLPDAPLREVMELPSLALALGFAVGRVPARKLSEGEIRAALDELFPLRAAALSYLEVAASPVVNLVPEERVRVIRAGSGKLDAAQDAVGRARGARGTRRRGSARGVIASRHTFGPCARDRSTLPQPRPRGRRGVPRRTRDDGRGGDRRRPLAAAASAPAARERRARSPSTAGRRCGSTVAKGSRTSGT